MKPSAIVACAAMCVTSAQLKLSPTFESSPTFEFSRTFALRRPFALCCPFTVSAPTLLAQAPPRDNVAPPAVGSARLSGRVIAADTGNPIARAQVQINSPALPKERQATTDASGRYEITGLPAGRYKLFVTRLGFVTIEYGQSLPFEAGRDLELFDGQTLDQIDF